MVFNPNGQAQVENHHLAIRYVTFFNSAKCCQQTDSFSFFHEYHWCINTCIFLVNPEKRHHIIHL